MPYSKNPEETLDPENWDELRALGHKMLDDMIDFQRDSVIKEYLKATPNDIEEICVHLPKKGEGEERVYDIVRNSISPTLVEA
jgi:aromatic-L-amino-acid decarboxylase